MKKHIRPLFVATVLASTGVVFADADSAKKYLAQAQTDWGNNDANAATSDIQLAETELDGVPDDAKAPITKDLATLKKTIADAGASAAKDSITKQIDQIMSDTKGELDAKQSFDEEEKTAQDFLAKDDVKAALGDDAVAKYLKTLSTYHKVAALKAYTANVAQAKDQLDQAEKDWPDKLKAMQNTAEPGNVQTATDDFGRTLDSIEAITKQLPGDKPEAAEQIARFKKLKTAYTQQVAMSKAGDIYDQMKRNWDSYSGDFTGWDQETTGPSFDDLLHKQGDTMDALQAPKTVALIQRANVWFDEQSKDENVRALATKDDKIKGLLTDMTTMRKQAWTKMESFAGAVLTDAEKSTINKESRDRLETFAEDNLRLDIEGSPNLKPLQARALKLVAGFDQQAIGDAAARQKLYDALVDQGNKKWPDLSGKIDSTDGLDAVSAMQNIENFKGKTVHLKAAKNRMGWDYSPNSGYDFAVTIDGVPVAAKFDPVLHKAFNQIAGKTGKDFSDQDYDVFAEIVGTGPIVKIARAEGTLNTTGGEKVADITAQQEETVQGIRMKIVAMHVGPLTGTSVQGVVDESGNLVQP